MANELRARDGMLAGTLDVDHTSGATTLTAAILAAHRAIGSTMHSAWVISDPYDGLIARTTYNPGSTTTYSTTSTTEAAIDATNLKVVFVAPRSGKVRIRLHAVGGVSSAAASLYWCVLNGSNVRQGATQYITQAIAANSADVTVPISGLTPGTSYTFYWGHNVDGAITGNTYVGGTAPSDYVATMDVYDDSEADAPANTEIVYVTAHTASAGTATIARGQEGTTAQAWKAGSRIVHGPTIRDFAIGRSTVKQRTAGNVGLPSAAWTAVDTALDISLAAVAGDVIEFGISCVWNDIDGAGGSQTAPNWASFDVATMNGAAIVAYFSNGTTSPGTGWAAWVTSGYTALQGVGGNAFHVVTAADIIGGSVTLRVYGGNGGTGTRTVRANTSDPFICWAKNLGPQEA